MADTLALVRESLGERAAGVRALAAVEATLASLAAHAAQAPAGLGAVQAAFEALRRESEDLRAEVAASCAADAGAPAAPAETPPLPGHGVLVLHAGDEPVDWAGALAAQCRAAADDLSALAAGADAAAPVPTLRALAAAQDGADGAARALLEPPASRSPAAPRRWRAMDQSFLYDTSRHLMHIGYNVDERRLDSGFYDLLASEQRLGSLRRHRPGAGAAGELVRARPPARRQRRASRCCSRGAARCSST